MMNKIEVQHTVGPGRFSVLLVLVLVLPTAVAFCLNLAADPFQIVFRDPPGEIAFLSKKGQDRYQVPGVVRHYQPTSIIVGHSLAANFQPSRVERVLGWAGNYNLSQKGSTIYEQRRVATLALANAPVEKVLWLFFPANLRLPAVVYTPKTRFPEYLYDESDLNDLRFFLTLPHNLAPYREAKQEARALLRRMTAELGTPAEARDYATNWQFTEQSQFNSPGAVAAGILGDFAERPRAYRKALADSFPPLDPEDIAALPFAEEDDFFANVETNLRRVVADNPEVEFVIIPMPPLTLLHWQHLRITEPRSYRNYLAYLREFVRIMAAYDNVSVHAFGLSPLAEDLRLYRDHGHYHMAVNEALLDQLAHGDSRLLPEQVLEYLSEFDQRVLQYRLRRYQPVEIDSQQPLRPGELSLRDGRQIVTAILRRERRGPGD